MDLGRLTLFLHMSKRRCLRVFNICFNTNTLWIGHTHHTQFHFFLVKYLEYLASNLNMVHPVVFYNNRKSIEKSVEHNSNIILVLNTLLGIP
jgi:hypothetical protein